MSQQTIIIFVIIIVCSFKQNNKNDDYAFLLPHPSFLNQTREEEEDEGRTAALALAGL